MEYSKKALEELQTTDPTIIFKNDIIQILPCYLNVSFIFNFILIPLFILALSSEEARYFGLLGILASLFNIGNFLRSNNKMIINQKEKNIIVIPNFISKYFIKKLQKIDFKNIKKVSVENDVPSLVFRRYVIVITLSTSQELKIISIGKRNIAEIVANVLKSLS